MEAQSGAGEFWGEALKERTAERGAGEKRFSFGKKAGAFCESEEDFGDESSRTQFFQERALRRRVEMTRFQVGCVE